VASEAIIRPIVRPTKNQMNYWKIKCRRCATKTASLHKALFSETSSLVKITTGITVLFEPYTKDEIVARSNAEYIFTVRLANTGYCPFPSRRSDGKGAPDFHCVKYVCPICGNMPTNYTDEHELCNILYQNPFPDRHSHISYPDDGMHCNKCCSKAILADEFYAEVKGATDGLRADQIQWMLRRPDKKILLYYLTKEPITIEFEPEECEPIEEELEV